MLRALTDKVPESITPAPQNPTNGGCKMGTMAQTGTGDTGHHLLPHGMAGPGSMGLGATQTSGRGRNERSSEVTSNSNYPVIPWSWWDTGCSISLHWEYQPQSGAAGTHGRRVRETEAHTRAARLLSWKCPSPAFPAPTSTAGSPAAGMQRQGNKRERYQAPAELTAQGGEQGGRERNRKERKKKTPPLTPRSLIIQAASRI